MKKSTVYLIGCCLMFVLSQLVEDRSSQVKIGVGSIILAFIGMAEMAGERQ